jgi:alpha-ribazole phosphatase
MRHFLTAAYKEGIYMGQGDYGICDTTIVNTNVLAETRECVLFVSALRRARETADFIVNEFKNIKFDVHIMPELIERGLGDFEGKPKTIIKQNSRYFLEGNFIIGLTPPNGESFSLFKQRIEKAYTQISYSTKANNVLVISHLQVLRMLHFIINEVEDYSNWHFINYKHGEMIA